MRNCAVAVLAIIVVAVLSISAQASVTAFSARVSGLPTVQPVGTTYPFTVTVKNTGKWIKFFCLDFNDDNGSWLIKGPGLISYPKSDGFCVNVLKKGTRKFNFVIIPAKSGSHTLEVILGKGKLYKSINKILVEDDNALSWSNEFVLG